MIMEKSIYNRTGRTTKERYALILYGVVIHAGAVLVGQHINYNYCISFGGSAVCQQIVMRAQFLCFNAYKCVISLLRCCGNTCVEQQTTKDVTRSPSFGWVLVSSVWLYRTLGCPTERVQSILANSVT